MATHYRRVAFLLLCLLSFGSEALANCEYINEYTDLFTWEVSESDGIARIEATGTAEGHGDECGNIYIEVSLNDPSGDTRHMRTGQGPGWASQTAFLETDQQEEEGDWSGRLMTWEDNAYIGCGGAFAGLANHLTYYKNPSGSPPNCSYASTACCPGTTAYCTAGVAVIFALSGCPPVVRVAYISIDGNCFKVGVGIAYPQTCGNCE